jgi:mxaK protein
MAAADDPQSHAELVYNLGNFMLRRGLSMYFTHPMRETAPVLRIAQAEYRAALQDDPGNWDARYNLDVVDALVRDDGAESPTTGTRMAPDKSIVPDEPGAPSGLP